MNAERENAANAGHRPLGRLRFQRQDRVVLQRDFARVFRARGAASNELLVAHAVANGLEWSRIGISVSRRVGNAVRRNYVKRRIREAFRTRRADIPAGFDFVFVAKPGSAARGPALEDAVVTLSQEVVRKASRRTTAGRPESRRSPPPS